MCRSLSAVVFFCLLSVLTFASSILPFNNLEHLSTSSDLIVIARASSEQTISQDGITSFYRNFQIQHFIKGFNDQDISIVSKKKVVGEYTNLIHGEFDFHSGDTYLLFLQKQDDGSYYPICLSYYVFQEIQKKGESYLVPAYEENSLQILKNKKEQILQVYNKDQFITELKNYSDTNAAIDFSKIVAAQENQTLTQAIKKAAPAHCSYLRTNNGLRFQVRNLDSQALPVYYQNGQSECSAVNAEMNSAVNHMNDNYRGINIQMAGSTSAYTSNCVGGNAYNISYFGGNYDVFMEQQFGTSRAVLVQFGDPCNEIPALNNCSGTVAFGGSWAVGSHTANGESFNTAVNGYVIVNDGMGSCNCGDVAIGSPVSDFAAIIAHELSHTIGLNHIENNAGNANMNPISGSQITNLDIECMDDLYPASTSSSPTEEPDNPGNEPNTPAGSPDLVSINCGVVTQNEFTVSYSGLRVRNSGDEASQATRIAYYLSTDNTITSNDILLGTAPLPALAVGANTAINNSFSVEGLPDGNYTIGAIIDDTNQISESNEDNNSCFIQAPNIVISTAPAGQPDLAFNICGRVSLQTNTIAINNLRVENAGNAAANGTIRIDYYASLDQEITTSDRLLNSQTINGLAAGAVETINTTMAIPDLADGNYVIGILLDSNNTVNESDESNNSCFDNNPRLVIETETPLSDLSINCGSLSISGSTASLSGATIRNVGSTSSPAGVQATISLMRNGSQTNILTRSLPAMQVNDSYELDHNFTIANLAEGTYNVLLNVDGVNILEEENEDNNSCTITSPAIVIEPEEELVADIDITNCGTVIQSGNELTISNAVVKNIGTGSTDGQFFLGYYLSLNKTINTADVYLGFDFINTLSAGNQSAESATFDLDQYDLNEGEYYVGLIADFNSRVTESNENNNTCRKENPKIIIGSEPEAEESITDITVSCGSISQSSNTITLSNAFVKNNGNQAITDGFFIGLYLSEDQTITTDDYLVELGQDYISNIGIGNSESINGNYSLNGIPPGDYYFGIIVDHSADIAEENENNNTCVITNKLITISSSTSNSPDLISTCNQAVVLTNEVNVTNMTVQNQGISSSGSYSFVGFYISADQEITTDDHYLGYDYVSILGEGGSSSESESFDISSLPLPDGNYYLGAIADFSERINESNESNNACVFSGVTIQLGSSDQTSGGSSAPLSDDCENISLTTFENGQIAPWVDGGGHAFINSGETYAATGQRSFALRGDAGQSSSIYLRDWINANSSSSYNLSFNVLTYRVERGDNLLVELDTGNGYEVLEKLEANVDFNPSENHAVSITFESNTQFKLRIRANTSHTYEYIFIDDIRVQECASSNFTTVSAQAKIEVMQAERLEIKLAPNPISLNGMLQVDIENEYSVGLINIYDSAGSLRLSSQLSGTKTTIPINILTNGLYYVSIIADDQQKTQKLIIVD